MTTDDALAAGDEKRSTGTQIGETDLIDKIEGAPSTVYISPRRRLADLQKENDTGEPDDISESEGYSGRRIKTTLQPVGSPSRIDALRYSTVNVYQKHARFMSSGIYRHLHLFHRC